MAIAGLKSHSQLAFASTVDATVRLFKLLGLAEDEQALRDSVAVDYARLTKLGPGRPYVALPSAVTTDQLIELADKLAAERGFDSVYRWAPFWVPGADRDSVTPTELNGSATGYVARVALFSAKPELGNDPLLHFVGRSYDEKYREQGQMTQREALSQAIDVFGNQHPGANLRAADHRDFLVWYIMDLIRDVPAKKVVLAQGFMRVPATGRRSVDDGSSVGCVCSGFGRARFDWSYGYADGDDGVGLSAGFAE